MLHTHNADDGSFVCVTVVLSVVPLSHMMVLEVMGRGSLETACVETSSNSLNLLKRFRVGGLG